MFKTYNLSPLNIDLKVFNLIKNPVGLQWVNILFSGNIYTGTMTPVWPICYVVERGILRGFEVTVNLKQTVFV